MAKCVVYDPKTKGLVEAVLRSEREHKMETKARGWVPATNENIRWWHLDERVPISGVCSIGSILVSIGYEVQRYGSRYIAMKQLVEQAVKTASEEYDADYVQIEKITDMECARYARAELQAIATMYIRRENDGLAESRMPTAEGKGPDGSHRNWI
ncbi:MAG TPA: hypothetical protein HA362_02920 [Nanoarchaeota archaeon]|nr:hypothetical protein [Nanoarchaeota archaeon]